MNPFAEAALQYWAKGWEGILPVRAGGKEPLVSKYSGKHGKSPDLEQIKAWIEEFPTANIGLRLPEGIIGVDVDHYGEKRGADTLTVLEKTLGPLPKTWISTSKDLPSGIRLFAVKKGARYKSRLGPGIDVIQHSHRHINVWPSIHPSGRQYKWIDPEGQDSSEVPQLDDFLS